MKNKRWIALALSACMCASFTACGDGNVHTHAYTVQNPTQTNLESEADCTNPARYYYVCECGERGTETYSYGEALGHDYTDGVCGECYNECLHTETQWETVVEAGCLADGTKNSVCVECGEVVDSGSIAASGHNFENGTCGTCGADLWDGTADVSWYKGDKSEYVIYTAEQLAGVSKLSAEGNTFENVTLTLKASVDLADIEWTPIGTDYTNRFMGTFNGNGLSISNMKITKAHNYAGLFGLVASQGTIKGFTLYNVDINMSSGYYCVGGLAGNCTGLVENCGVTGKISVGASMATNVSPAICYVGGAFGNVTNATSNVFADCEVKNVYSDVPTQIDIKRNIGGFAGSAKNATNCYALGNVTYDCQAEIDYGKNNVLQAWAYVGGFAGFSQGARNCYATGDVIAKGTFWSDVGGFAGFSQVAGSCYATGDVTVNSVNNNLAGGYTGGLIGYEENTNATITYCYATGNVSITAKGSSDAGGLIGRNSSNGTVSVSDSYATGNVTLVGGRQCAAGGLIGRNFTAGTEKTYATGNVTITNTDETASQGVNITCEAGGLIGKTEGNVKNSYASGNVNATSYADNGASVYAYVGGLIGYVEDSKHSENSPNVTVLNTYAIGNVTLTMPSTSGGQYGYVAGLVGYLNYAQLSRSFVANDVKIESCIDKAGAARPLIGWNGNAGGSAADRVFQCYAAKGRKLIKTVTNDKTTENVVENFNVPGFNPSFTEPENLQSVGFMTGNLAWSTEIWNMTDGQYPTLYWDY